MSEQVKRERFAKLTTLEISLKGLQEALKGKVNPEECVEHFKRWEQLKKNGDDLLERLDTHIEKLPRELSKAFPSVIAVTEEWFNPNFNSHNNQHYKGISPLVVAIYDLLISLKRAYEHKSAISCGMITRAIFEARVHLAEISQNPDIYVNQFNHYKDVERFWNEYRNEQITKEQLITNLKNYTEWYDDDWKILKKKRENWTGMAGDNLRVIAERNNLGDEYKALYKVTSSFVHISPLLSNYYSVNGNSPLCNERAVFEMGYIGLQSYIEALAKAFEIVGLDSTLLYQTLLIPFATLK